MQVAIVALLGLILGSFLSVVLERLPKDKPGIVTGRSECPHCQRVLAWYDLIPLLSYVFLLGRCRQCKASISLFYPALELSMGIVLGSYAYLFGLTNTRSVIELAILFGLVSLFFFDLRYQILPDIITLPLIILVLLGSFFGHYASLTNIIATSAAMALVFGLIYVSSHGRWLGLGDVKLSILIGLLFGYPKAIGVTLIAVWTGAVVGLVLIAARRANMKTALPFGSFWTLAAIITILFPGPIGYISGLFTLTFK